MDRESNNPAQEIYDLEVKILKEIRLIRRMLEPDTPIAISFKEITMNSPVPGSTLVFTGTLEPAGSEFPAGTTFTVGTLDPTGVTVTVDPKGLVVTAVILPGAVAGTNAEITWTTSTFTPEPSTSPTSLSATIPLVIAAAPVATPTAVSFVQTT